MENAIHWINLYAVDMAIVFPNTYPLDSNLSYPALEQPEPELYYCAFQKHANSEVQMPTDCRQPV